MEKKWCAISRDFRMHQIGHVRRTLRHIYACPREKRITFKLDGINYVSVHIAHALNDTTNKLFKIIIKIVRVIATNQNRRWNAENVR